MTQPSLGELADELASIDDPNVRQRARAFAAAVLDAHGAGLARLLELVDAHAGGDAAHVLQAALDDPIVSSLLVLHDLHPVPVDQRVQAAVSEAIDQLGPVGAHVSLVEVAGDTVTIRVEGPADSPQARVGIEALLARTLRTRAPDVDHLVLASSLDDAPAGGRRRLPLVVS